jgi:hypothetical protein
VLGDSGYRKADALTKARANKTTRARSLAGSFGLAMAAVLGGKKFPVTLLMRKQVCV